MSVLSNQCFYWANDEIIYIPARYTVDSEGNVICTHSISLEHVFDEVTSVSSYGLNYAFRNCTGIVGNVAFPELITIGDYGLNYIFYGCTGITSFSFPELTTIGDYGLYMIFDSCTRITSVSFPKLTTIDAQGLNNAFYGCTEITGSVSFPELTTIGAQGLKNVFYGCKKITELHFKSAAQSAVKATDGYGSKFGASNATIYFDL